MALEEGQIQFSGVKALKDATKDRFDIQAVAVVGETGKQAGTLQSPVNVQAGDIFDRIETQLRIMNLHLAHITDQDFSEEDF